MAFLIPFELMKYLQANTYAVGKENYMSNFALSWKYSHCIALEKKELILAIWGGVNVLHTNFSIYILVYVHIQ